MPDLISPIAPPQIDIKDIDLSKVIADSKAINDSSAPAQKNNSVDWQAQVNLPGVDTKNYQPNPQTFATERLKNVAGYDSFKSNSEFNPEISDIANTRNYALNQGTGEYAYNLGAKLFDTTTSSFINAFNQNGRNIDALMNLDVDKLYSTQDDAKRLDELRYKYPTFGTGENDDSWTRFNPFTAGKADFWGEFVPQLGFTIGTIGETLAENALIALATGGIGNVAAAANTATKLSKAQNLMKGLWSAVEASNGITNFRKAMGILDSIKDEGSLLSTIGKGAIKGAKSLANGYAMYNTAAGEASFEANNLYNSHLKELTDDFVEKNGYQPTPAVLEQMKNNARSAAFTTFAWNMPILLGSNLVQFGNILKPFKTPIGESVADEAFELAGKGLKKSIVHVGEAKLGSKISGIFEGIEKYSLGRLSAESLSEGAEEVAQSYASNGANQYYKDLYNGITPNGALRNSLSELWNYSFSKAYFDDFVGGWLGGMIFSDIGRISQATGLRDSEFGKKYLGESDKAKEAAKNASIQNATDVLNSASNEQIVKWLFKPEVQNFVRQAANKRSIQNAESRGDNLGFVDAQNQSVRDLIYAGLQTGKLEVALSKLDIFKELDNADLAAVSGVADMGDLDGIKDNASEMVETIKQKARGMQESFADINRRYPNPFTAGSMKHHAFEMAKRDRLFTKDIVQEDQKRAKNLRSKISSISEGRVNSNIINHAIDIEALDEQIKFLEAVRDNTIDKDSHVYRSQMLQLSELRDIRKERNKKNPSYNKMAKSILIASNTNQLTTDLRDDIVDETVKGISDLLKLEDRNKLNLAYFNLLNNRPIEQSMSDHIQAMTLLSAAIKPKQPPAQANNKATKPAETVKQATPASPTTSLEATLTAVESTLPANTTPAKTTATTTAPAAEKKGTGFLTEMLQNGGKPPSTTTAAAESKTAPAKQVTTAFTLTDEMKNEVEAGTYWVRDKAVAQQVAAAMGSGYTIKYVERTARPKDKPPYKVGGYRVMQYKTLPTNLSIETPDAESLRNQEYNSVGSLPLASVKAGKDIAPPAEQLSKVNTLDNQFHRRKDQFLENLHLERLPVPGKKNKFWKRDDVKITIITPNNVANFGKNLDVLLSNKDVNDVDTVSIMFLFTVEEKGQIHPITKDGVLLPPLSPSSEYKMEDLVYSFNEPSTLNTYSEATARMDKKGVSPEKYQERHRAKRAEWLAATTPLVKPFQISHGVPNSIKGNRKRNTLKDVSIVPDKQVIAWDDIYIPTTTAEFEEVNTDSLTPRNLRSGRPYFRLKGGNGTYDYQRLENEKLTPNQKGSILLALKNLMDQFHAGKPITENNEEFQFLKNVLFLQSGKQKDVYARESSIYIKQNPKSGVISILYDFSGKPKEIALTKDDTVSILTNPEFKVWLDNRYFNIQKPFKGSFSEFYVKNKKLEKRVWPSYAQYLVDSRNPDKSQRDPGDVPLKVELYTPQQQADAYEGGDKYPTFRKQYYISLGDKIKEEKGVVKTKTTNTDAAPVKQTTPKKSAGFLTTTLINLENGIKPAPVQIAENPTLTYQEKVDKLNEERVKEIRVNKYLPNKSPAKKTEAFINSQFEAKIADLGKVPKEGQRTAAPAQGTKKANGFLTQMILDKQNQPKSVPEEIDNIAEQPFEDDDMVFENWADEAPATTKEEEEEVKEASLEGPKMSLRGKKTQGKRYNKLFERDANYKPEDIEAIKSFFATNLPQVGLETTDRLINIGNSLAWGTFQDSVVTIYDEAIAGTGYHEAFEVVFNALLNEKEQNNLLREFKARKGTFSNFATTGPTQYSEATDDQAREELAEEFMRYKLGEQSTPHRNIFQKIFDFIRSFLLNLPSINDVFSNLDNGYYANKALTTGSRTFTRLVNVDPIEEGYILKGITYEMMNDLFNETKSFTQFDETFNEKELYDKLYSLANNFYNSQDEEQTNTFWNVVMGEFIPQIEAIENNPKLSEKVKNENIARLEREAFLRWNKQAERWNTLISPQWNEVVDGHKKFLKQLGIISFVEVENIDGEIEEDDANMNEYTRDAFKIDIKNSAPKSIKLLFNTIAESVFNFDDTQSITGNISIPAIVPKLVNSTGMVNLFDGGNELFNVVLSQVAEVNTIDGIKAKIENLLGIDEIRDMEEDEAKEFIKAKTRQQDLLPNSVYTHLFVLYNRVFNTDPSELSEQEVKQRLRFLSTFSKQKPDFRSLIISDTEVFLLDEVRDNAAKSMVSKWMNNFYAIIADKKRTSLLTKSSKQPFIVNFDEVVRIANFAKESQDKFILEAARSLGMQEFNKGFLESLTLNEKNYVFKELFAIFKEGLGKVWDGKKKDGPGRKVYKLDPARIGVVGRYTALSNFVIAKFGDDTEAIHNNIEGEQQQNIVQNNAISNVLSSLNIARTKDEFLKRNPRFNDPHTASSVLLDKMFDENGDRTSFMPRVTIIGGLRNQSSDVGKKSSNQSLGERLYQEFNVNLSNIFYILSPADSETEWALNVGKETYLKYTNDVISEDNFAPFIGYLRSEIESAIQFVDEENSLHEERTKNENLNVTRPLIDGTLRTVGSSLQVFKDVLTPETVNDIHSLIDQGASVDDIMESIDAYGEISDFVIDRVRQTFQDLSKESIVEREGRELGEFDTKIDDEANYIFYGLESNFAEEYRIPHYTAGELEVEQKNQYFFTGDQLFNLIAFREMSYMMNNIEMTKLFFGNPYFYKDILKRTKSSMSPRDNSYVQYEGDAHTLDEWFNANKNNVEQKDKNGNIIGSHTLPSDHLHNHEFKSHINTWVFKDHFTLNKELGEISEKYYGNNATDAQSFSTLNLYREFYWKNGAKFRDSQEKQFQIEMAYERYLLDKDGKYPYTDMHLQNLDNKILEPYLKEVKGKMELVAKEDVFEIFKPIGSGALANQATFDPFIWKTSVAPITYRMVRGTPMQDAYMKMLTNGIDMLTFESAIKVGLNVDPRTEKVNSLIATGSFATLGKVDPNLSSYNHKMPFDSVGLQLETSTQKNKGTIGTQTTKLITTDMFEYGIPRDFMMDIPDYANKLTAWYALNETQKLAASDFYRMERRHNQAIVNLENFGYSQLLDRLGVTEIVTPQGNKEYQYDDLSKVYQLLKEEMVKRGLSPNIYDMFDDVTIKEKPLEALSNYNQASFIIMAVVRKSITKPKLNGGQKIQASSVLLNKVRNEGLEASYFNIDEKKWEPVTTEEQFNALSDKEKSSITYTSNQLSFYRKAEDGSTLPMEVLLPNSFREKLDKARKRKKDANGDPLPEISDSELLSYLKLNQKELLAGVGFRIPTQALSSIDTFVVKGFLPSYMGDSVVVPSELTTKVGSDFDVDKLNTYLTNWTVNSKGFPEYIQPLSSISEGKEKYGAEFDTKKAASLQYKMKLLSAVDAYLQFQDADEDATIDEFTSRRMAQYITKNQDFLDTVLDKFETDEEALDALAKSIAKIDGELTDEAIKAEIKNQYIAQRLRGALENEYFASMDAILRTPTNFEKLLSPNNSDEFSDAGGLRDRIMESLGRQKRAPKGYIDYSTIINSSAMRYSRWSYVLGKKGVGIAALSATNHALSQKIGLELQTDRFEYSASQEYKGYKPGDSVIRFNHNQVELDGIKHSVLSGITKNNGQNIAEFVSKYINGYVDVSKDAWILDIGAQIDVAGVYLLMERLGIDEEEIIYFLNQPSVRYYLSVKAQKKSPIVSINPRLKEALKNVSDEKLRQVIKDKLLPDTEAEFVSKFNIKNLKEAVERTQDHPKFSQWVENSNTSERQEQFNVFDQFMKLKQYADYIRASQTASNHDTANLNSLHLLDDKDETLGNLLMSENPLITQLGSGKIMAQALRDTTFVGNIVDNLHTIDDNLLSKSLFRIQNKAVRMQIRKIMHRLNPSIFYENDRRLAMDRLTKAIINILTLNTTLNSASGESSLIEHMEGIMKYDKLKGILKQVENVIKNPDAEVKQKLKEASIDLADIKNNKWINYLTVRTITEGSDFAYLSLADKKPYNDNFEKQIWIEDFQKLKAMPFTQSLYKTILAATLYQSGAEYNKENFMELIPWQDYTIPINNGLNNLEIFDQINIERTLAQIKAYDTNFIPQLTYFSAGTVNGKRYYPKTINISYPTATTVQASKLSPLYSPKKFMDRWIKSKQKNTRGENVVEEISTLILVPSESYTANKQNYFTLKQESFAYGKQEVLNMIANKLFDYQRNILFEKTPLLFKNGLEEFVIFRPINTKGHRYNNEYSGDNEHSILDHHEEVNPELIDTNQLYEVLNTFHPGKVFNTEEQFEQPNPTTDEETTEGTLPVNDTLVNNQDEEDTTEDRTSIKDMEILPLNNNFDRASVEADDSYIYLFTDNAGRTSGSNQVSKDGMYAKVYNPNAKYPTKTQAVIRGLNNAYPITTMVDDKKTQWTDDRFEEYKKIIDLETNNIRIGIESGEFDGIKFSAQMPFGKGSISDMKNTAPKIWAYLNEKLKEIRIDNTGEHPVEFKAFPNGAAVRVHGEEGIWYVDNDAPFISPGYVFVSEKPGGSSGIEAPISDLTQVSPEEKEEGNNIFLDLDDSDFSNELTEKLRKENDKDEYEFLEAFTRREFVNAMNKIDLTVDEKEALQNFLNKDFVDPNQLSLFDEFKNNLDKKDCDK